MYWNGFAAASNIDSVLEQPDVTLEQVLDEPEVLQEAKAQNAKLAAFLAQPPRLRRLLAHVVGQAHVPAPPPAEHRSADAVPDDVQAQWQEKVHFKYPYLAAELITSDVAPVLAALFAHPDATLVPFWNSLLSFSPQHPLPPLPYHQHPLFAASVRRPLHPSPHPPAFPSLHKPPPSPPPDAARPDPSQPPPPSSHAVLGPGANVLAGYWAKVNVYLLEKRPREFLAFLQAQPYIVERFAAHAETPAVVDLLYRIIASDQTSEGKGIIDWLSEHRLVPCLVSLLSSTHSVEMHNNVAELLTTVISLSAPPLTGGAPGDGAGGLPPAQLLNADGTDASIGGQTDSVSNALVRDLASQEAVDMLVTLMFDEQEEEEPRTPDQQEVKAKISVEEESEEALPLPLNPLDTPSSEAQLSEYFAGASSASAPTSAVGSPSQNPAMAGLGGDFAPSSQSEVATASGPPKAPRVHKTTETKSSALTTCIGIIIELIRKNNSDYFEQHLFHALRQALLQKQQDLDETRLAKKQQPAVDSAGDSQKPSPTTEQEDALAPDELAAMESEIYAMTDKAGIVHLGPLLCTLSGRMADMQRLLLSRDSEHGLQTTIGSITPLTFDRYRVCELYAELLHCSNMALLNRPPGTGPTYDSRRGTLVGGLDGFQALTDALQSTDLDLEEEAVPPASLEDSQPTPTTEKAGETNSSTAGNGARASTTGSEEEEVPLDQEFAKRVQLVASEVSAPPAPPANLVPGDLLKERFISCGVVRTLVDLFFAFPWNNFLHNVVYDVLQQCFNGRMTANPVPVPATAPASVQPSGQEDDDPFADPAAAEGTQTPTPSSPVPPAQSSSTQGPAPVPERGYNHLLTLDVFERGDLCGSIVRGYHANDASEAGSRKIRLGFMGHLSLIAEEVTKVLERYPSSLAAPLRGNYTRSNLDHWDALVASLRAARDREANPLGAAAVASGQSGDGLDDRQVFGTDPYGEPVSGLGLDASGAAQHSSPSQSSSSSSSSSSPSSSSFANYLSAQIRGGADDDDSDEDAAWPQPSGGGGAGASRSSTGAPLAHPAGFDDDDDGFGFDEFQSAPAPGEGGAGGFDDDWGPFTGTVDASTDAFGDADDQDPFMDGSGAGGGAQDDDWAAEYTHPPQTATTTNTTLGWPTDSETAESEAEDVVQTAPSGPLGARLARSASTSSSDSGSSSSTGTGTGHSSVPGIGGLGHPGPAKTSPLAMARDASLGGPPPPLSPLVLGRTSGSAGSTGLSKRHRRRSSASSTGSTGSLELAAEPGSPLGPGVDAASTVVEDSTEGTDTCSRPGPRLVRTLDVALEPTRVQVPLDDVALAITEGEGEDEDDGLAHSVSGSGSTGLAATPAPPNKTS